MVIRKINLPCLAVWAVSLLAAAASAQDSPSPEAAPVVSVSLLENGGFEAAGAEDPAKAAGWSIAGSRATVLDAEVKVAGGASLRVGPGETAQEVMSTVQDLPEGLRTLSALVMAQGPADARAVVRWWAAAEDAAAAGVPLREDMLTAGIGEGWRRLSLGELAPPEGAGAVQLVLQCPPATAPLYWDQAQLTALAEEVPEIKVLMNQAGYELLMPKRFVISANFQAHEAQFRLLDPLDNEVLSGPLTGGEEIRNQQGESWGAYYWHGEFTGVDVPGSYLLEVQLDEHAASSAPFDIGEDLLWERTLPIALQCFAAHRCGVAVAGYHAACHLDDAQGETSLAGGWHDGSSYDKGNNIRLFWKLAEAYQATHWRLKERPDGQQFEAELEWGSGLLRRALQAGAAPLPLSKAGYWGPPEQETDNLAGTGDERRLQALALGLPLQYAAALSRWKLRLADPAYAEEVKTGVDWGREHLPGHPLYFAALCNIWQARKDLEMVPILQAALPPAQLEVADELIAFASDHGEIELIQMVMQFTGDADAIVRQTDKIFGIYLHDEGGKSSYFSPTSGNTQHILAAAEKVAKVYRMVPKPEYLQFIYDQFNWILGVNPFCRSLMAGAGTDGISSYHHPYSTCGVAGGIVPGAIANGVAARAPGDDRPRLDVEGGDAPEQVTNGVSLMNTAHFLNTLAQLKRIPAQSGEAARETADAE